MLLIAIASPVIYAHPPASQPASIFLLTPLFSWVLLGAVVPFAVKLR